MGGEAWSAVGGALAAGEARSYLDRLFVAGGPIVWFALLPLSVAAVSLIVQYLLAVRRSRFVPAGVVERLRRAGQAGGAGNMRRAAEGAGDVLSQCVRAGLGQPAGGRAAVEAAFLEALEQQESRWLRRIERLNIIGNVAPMIGLLGTVWGMIEAFDRIVRAGGQPTPEQLAGAISVALVTTLWGLSIAIPALATYGVLRNRLEELTTAAAGAGEDLVGRVTTDKGGGV